MPKIDRQVLDIFVALIVCPSRPLAHLVDPFKQVNLIVNDERDTNGHTTGRMGEMHVEEEEKDDSDMRVIEVKIEN